MIQQTNDITLIEVGNFKSQQERIRSVGNVTTQEVTVKCKYRDFLATTLVLRVICYFLRLNACQEKRRNKTSVFYADQITGNTCSAENANQQASARRGHQKSLTALHEG